MIRLAMWTRPTAGGEVAGGDQREVQREREHVRIGRRQLVTQEAKHTPRVLGQGARYAHASERQTRAGTSPPPPAMNGSAEAPGMSAALRAYSASIAAALSSSRLHHAPSRLWPQTRTTLPLTPGEPGGQPGDRLGDVDRQPALGEAAHPPAGLADGHRHRRGHLGLDEARSDGVDGHPALGEQRGERLHDADHARLGGGVVRLPGVAGDPADRRDADDPPVAGARVALEQRSSMRSGWPG